MKKKGKPIKDVTGRDIYFAAQEKVDKIYLEVTGFIKNIFGISPVFVSDESSLYDFLGTQDNVKTIEDVVDKVMKVYGIDINNLSNRPIVYVVNHIIKRIKGSLS